MMRLLIFFATFFAALASFALAAPPVVVHMKSLSYDPKRAELPAGGSVIWENSALTEHSATSDDDGKTFDTGMVVPKNASKAVTFDKPGTYPYHCSMHGKTMSGTVVVTGISK